MKESANYLKTYQQKKLEAKIKQLNSILSSCTLCPRKCKVNRNKDERGFCGAGKDLYVSSIFPHFGEESCLVGSFGSGTIFFTYCNLKCIFCQNDELSHQGLGSVITKESLAKNMLHLQRSGCHNINLVTPTHFAPQILEGLLLAIQLGLNIPLVYNCGGYESEEVIDILDGIVDIYMPDVKFSSSDVSSQMCQAPDYFINLKQILKKMHKQVGDLKIEEGIAKKGLLLRHLVLPEGLAGTSQIMEFIAREISVNSYINIMDQYRPCGQAYQFPRISRKITPQEYTEAIRIARSFGLSRFD